MFRQASSSVQKSSVQIQTIDSDPDPDPDPHPDSDFAPAPDPDSDSHPDPHRRSLSNNARVMQENNVCECVSVFVCVRAYLQIEMNIHIQIHHARVMQDAYELGGLRATARRILRAERPRPRPAAGVCLD